MLKHFLYLLFPFLLLSINCYSQNADINLLEEINLNRNESLDPFFRSVTNSVYPVNIAAPVLTYSIGIIKKDTSLKQKGIFIGETFLVSAFITTALKYSVNRDRPYETYPYIENDVEEDSPSFPSGHTSSAFATATSLSIAFPKWYVIAPSYLWAGAVGYSRMHLGEHYPSNVLAGAIIGSGSAFLTIELNKWLNKKLVRQKKRIFFQK